MRTLATLLFSSALLACAQEAAQTFEVPAIKLSDASSRIGIRRLPGGRFVTSNTSLRLLITWTYDIGDERLVGAPAWLDSARFDVAAKAPNENPTGDDLRSMMKSLLADRFKLRVHAETRDLPMYTLSVDKNGPKVHTRDAPLAINHDPFEMTGSGRLKGTSVTATMLAKVLTNQLGHFVRDNTGFTGVFDFTLEWRPDSAEPGEGPEADARASIFTAIREQLGFRLTSGRAAVEVIAIDHVEARPTDN
jgi:uncharacterized protein (TIGR03435 family)